MDEIKREIAKNIRHYRNIANITQKELADQLGIRSTAVSSWETGVNAIDIETLYRVCKILGITFTEVFGEYAKLSTDDITPKDIVYIKKYHRLNKSDKSTVDFILNKPEYDDTTTHNDDEEIAKTLSDLAQDGIKKSTACFNKA